MHGAPGDIQLLETWREGDRKAGSELFRRHFASVQRFFRNAVEPSAIDDLVQSTFIACVESRDRFEGRSSFRGYLFGVAHNILRAHYRARRRGELLDFGVTSAADMGTGPSTLLGRKREQRVLIEALRQIPLDSQILLQLRYWEQLRTAELGEFLGVPRGTAVDRLRRAKAQLEQAIARLEASPEVLESTLVSLDGWAASLRQDSDGADPQLSAVIPAELDGRPLVARRSEARLELATYRGRNAEIELSLRRLEPDDARLAAAPHEDARPVTIGAHQGWLQWSPEQGREARVHLRIDWVLLSLRLSPAVRAEAAVELLERLELGPLLPENEESAAS